MSWLLLLPVAVIGIAAVLYNRLVRDRNRVDAAWSDIDVQLQRRHDLVAQLVEAVGRYAQYEHATLDAMAELRAGAAKVTGIAERGRLERDLSDGIGRLLALAEQYPDLKASENFLNLQRQLIETENYLQFARRYYNGSVRELNTRVESVPGNIIAGSFGFEAREHFQRSSDDVDEFPTIDLSVTK